MSEFHHVSVLLEECIQGLAIKPDGIYVDGTLGGAGHSSRIAAKLTTGRLIGIDRDNVALEAAAERLKPYEDRVTLVHANFCDMDEALQELGIDKVDGILLTGGLMRYDDILKGVEQRCGWIAPIAVYPGECEQEAMADAVLEVLRGQRKANRYTGIPVFRGFDWDKK
mgnify:CR=1 FL=1